jgi:quercetin dioxygenase-like cupin family protein
MNTQAPSALSLTELADEQLAVARTAGSGRSAHTVHGGHEHALRQTLIALTAGSRLAEHNSPGEATLQVLRGRVRLTTAAERARGAPATCSSSPVRGTR